ncbi:MAG: hypothetical protein H7Y38_08415 [Armatimonadetes bacterium]|nr:hypothetical protein [Armatimonadota bacterium]
MDDKPFPLFDLEAEARTLAETNHDFEPAIIRTYWFPDPAKREVRLVHISTDTFEKDGVIRPFYFAPYQDDKGFVPPTAIALITPEQERSSSLPKGWGDWDNADVWVWGEPGQ